MKHGRLIEISQVRHIFALLKLSRINLLNLILLQDTFLLLVRSGPGVHLNRDLVALSGVNNSFDKASFLEWDPA